MIQKLKSMTNRNDQNRNTSSFNEFASSEILSLGDSDKSYNSLIMP